MSKTTVKEIREELLLLYDEYSEKYRELIPTYEALKKRKQELGVTKGKIKSTVAKELPDIPFLKAKDHKAAEEYLKKLNLEQLEGLSEEIEYSIRLGYEYNTIFNWNIEAKSLIKIAEDAIAAKEDMAQYGNSPVLISMKRVKT